MLAARSGLTLRLLPDGKVQAIGGDDEATMELFNPLGYFTSLGHLGQDRQVLAAALRNTGRAALIGSPVSSRPSLSRLSAEGTDPVALGDVLDRSSYTLTELPGASAAILIGGVRPLARRSKEPCCSRAPRQPLRPTRPTTPQARPSSSLVPAGCPARRSI